MKKTTLKDVIIKLNPVINGINEKNRVTADPAPETTQVEDIGQHL